MKLQGSCVLFFMCVWSYFCSSLFLCVYSYFYSSLFPCVQVLRVRINKARCVAKLFQVSNVVP
jgi:hypothetical protein